MKKNFSLNLQPGESVEVRSKKEICATLDEDGSFEGLLFNSEMYKYCGKKFRVLRQVNKINVVDETVMTRNIRNTIILEGVTCNGEDHGECQRLCLLLWKEAWLKRAKNSLTHSELSTRRTPSIPDNASLLEDEVFLCQVTNLINAASPHFWDIWQISYDISIRAQGTAFYKPLKLLHVLVRKLNFIFNTIFGLRKQHILQGKLRRTPTVSLSLQPGELVEVKRKDEILATLDFRGRNRGLLFHHELLKYCGRRYRVLKRVNKILNEQTGQLNHVFNTVILEGVTCDGKFHGDCQRNCYCLWREAWLKRIE